MERTQKAKNEYVRKSTMLTVAFITFTVGFLVGIAFSLYKSGSSKPLPAPPQPAPRPNLSQTIVELELQTAQNPSDVTAWTQLGNLYFDTDQHKKAINAYKKSLELNPQNADIWTDMGVMYRRNKQPLEAIKAFDKAIEVNPRHEISRFNKGIVFLHDLNDLENAIRAWEDLLKVNPLYMAPNGQSVDQLVVQLKKQPKSQ
jgi:cytochrome c-type biogenesis protein CcmH/NrfG